MIARTDVTTSHLYHEIHEQPRVLEKVLTQEWAAATNFASAIRQRDIAYVLIAARGTSDNAGRYANYLFGALNGLPVGLALPSLYTLYRQPPRLRNALVIGISQSGKSPDIVSVLADARSQGALTLAITNFDDSELANHADFVLDLHAGVEKSIAATKTYTSELLTIAMLAAALNGEARLRQELERVPDAIQQILAVAPEAARAAERYCYMQSCVVIGRGYNYASAVELALKLKELTYTLAEPYSRADFMHGPLALIENGFPAIVVAPSGITLAEMQAFIRMLHQREADPIVISDDAETLDLGRTRLPLAVSLPEWLSPIGAIVPGQLFAMHLAHTRGYDPDHPRGLRKVTETH